MNIDFRYRSIEIDKKVLTSSNMDHFPIEIDDFFIDCYQLLSIPIDFYGLW